MSSAASSNVIPFSFTRDDRPFEVRVYTRDGLPWFVTADVCRVLDIGNPSAAAALLDPDERDTLISNEASPNGIAQNRTVGIVSESGLYTLIMNSRKPSARPFRKWVTSEVLPTIRRTGSYGGGLGTLEPIMARIAAAAECQAAAVKVLAVDLRATKDDVSDIKTDVGCLKSDLNGAVARIDALDIVVRKNVKQRRGGGAPTQRTHCAVLADRYHCRCPACNDELVITPEGVRLPGSQFDHYISVNKPDVFHSWILCTGCHADAHSGPHSMFDPAFTLYQQRLREHLAGAGQFDLLLPVPAENDTQRKRRRAA